MIIDSTEQQTAPIGILGAIVGYLFGTHKIKNRETNDGKEKNGG